MSNSCEFVYKIIFLYIEWVLLNCIYPFIKINKTIKSTDNKKKNLNKLYWFLLVYFKQSYNRKR